MSAKLLTTGSAKVRKIKPAKAKAGSSVAGGGRNETGHLQNSNSFHERYAAARGLSRVAREKNASRRKMAGDGILSCCFYLFKKISIHMETVEDGRSVVVPEMGRSGPSVFGDDELLQFLLQALTPGGDEFFKGVEAQICLCRYIQHGEPGRIFLNPL